jgi:hypothetical protein
MLKPCTTFFRRFKKKRAPKEKRNAAHLISRLCAPNYLSHIMREAKAKNPI